MMVLNLGRYHDGDYLQTHKIYNDDNDNEIKTMKIQFCLTEYRSLLQSSWANKKAFYSKTEIILWIVGQQSYNENLS